MAEAEKKRKRRSKKAEKAEADVERQAKRYDEGQKHPATDIDREPFYNPTMEKEEERINREADEKAAARANGVEGEQREMFPEISKEQVEEQPHVRSAKVKLLLTVELEGEKPITLPLMLGSMPSDRVQEMMGYAIKSRRNRRRIEAALDLPEPKEETFDKPVAETLKELEARGDSNPEVCDPSKTIAEVDPSKSAAPAPGMESSESNGASDETGDGSLSDSARETEGDRSEGNDGARQADTREDVWPVEGEAEVNHVDTVDHEHERSRSEAAHEASMDEREAHGAY